METIESNNRTEHEWVLLTPPAWITKGFSVSLTPTSFSRQTDEELEELIEKSWQQRQDKRKAQGLRPEEPWEKTGYHAHQLYSEERKVDITLRTDSNWKAFMSTNHNPKFLERLVEIYNRRYNITLSAETAGLDKEFVAFASPYLDNTIGYSCVLKTPDGAVVGLRDEKGVTVFENYWAVFESTLPRVGGEIYRKPVPVINGVPIVGTEKFSPDMDSVLANCQANLFDETGGSVLPQDATWSLAGIIRIVNSSIPMLVYYVETNKGRKEISRDCEHKRFEFIPPQELPSYLNTEKKLIPSSQFALVAALVRESGLDAVEDLNFVRSITV